MLALLLLKNSCLLFLIYTPLFSSFFSRLFSLALSNFFSPSNNIFEMQFEIFSFMHHLIFFLHHVKTIH
jgi:hypothetical protein